MKATEYYEKYKDIILNEGEPKNLLMEMSQEVIDISKQRNSRTNSTFFSLINEMNQKWNSVANMMEKKFNQPILKRNGFKKVWDEKLQTKNINVTKHNYNCF